MKYFQQLLQIQVQNQVDNKVRYKVQDQVQDKIRMQAWAQVWVQVHGRDWALDKRQAYALVHRHVITQVHHGQLQDQAK